MEANYKADPQLEATGDMIVKKNPKFAEKVRAMGGYMGQYTNDFHVRDGCLWQDEQLALPIQLRRPIINRIHSYHYLEASMFDAARDIWLPYFYRS